MRMPHDSITTAHAPSKAVPCFMALWASVGWLRPSPISIIPLDKGRQTSMSDNLEVSLAMREPAARRSLDSFKAVFLGKPIDPQALRNRVLQRLQMRKRVDREIEVSQIPDSTFVMARVDRLQENPDADYLAHLYGIRTANRRVDIDEQRGLRQLNVNSAFYQRGSPNGDFRQLCADVYSKKLPDSELDSKNFAYAHSLSAVGLMRVQASFQITEAKKRLTDSGLSEEERTDLEKNLKLLPGICQAAPTQIAPGLVAISCSEIDATLLAQKLLEVVGGFPSNYQVVKHLKSERSVANGVTLSIQLNDARQDFDNAALLQEIVARSQTQASTLRLPADHPAGPVMRATQSVITGLIPALQGTLDTGVPRRSTLLYESLTILRSLSDAMATMVSEPERLSSVYQVVLDEIFLLLAAVRPYKLENFNTAVINVLQTRVGYDLLNGMDVAEPEAFLVSSGMEAMAIGIQAARVASPSEGIAPLSDKPRGLIPDYFEVRGLLPAADEPNNRIFTAVQNPSTPRLTQDGDGGWNVQELVRELQGRAAGDKADAADPLVVVLDATVEKATGPGGHSDLRYVVESLRDPIASGELRLILCKSYQKFPSLSSGKIMGGSVVILSKDDPWLESAQEHLRDHQDGTGWAENDESQLLTHFLNHGHQSELELVTHAAQNARFVGQFCFPGQAGGEAGFDRYQPELPFGLISNVDIQLKAEVTGVDGPVDDLSGVMRALVETRNSFGFLETTSGFFLVEGVPSVRLSFGQESREELTERFYGVGQLRASKLGREGKGGAARDTGMLPIDQTVIREATEKIAAEAADEVLAHAKLDSWAHRGVRILERRAADRTDPRLWDDVKDLLDRMNEMAPDQQQLREELEKQLKATAPTDPGSKLTDDLIVVGAALALEPPDALRAGGDIDAMRANLGARGLEQPTDATRYAPNMIASLLDMAGRVRGSETEAIRLHEAVLASGMRGISPAGRTRTVMAWARLVGSSAPEYMSSPAKGQPAPVVAAMIKHANFISYPEDKARLFAQLLPAFSSLDPEDQDELGRALYLPSNLDARPGILASLAEKGDGFKVSICLRVALAEHRVGIRKNQSERIAGPSLGARDGLEDVGLEEVENYMRALFRALVPTHQWKGFEQRMRAWTPIICKGVNSAETAGEALVELAKLAEQIFTNRRHQSDDDSEADAPLVQIDGLLTKLRDPFLSLGSFICGLCEEELSAVTFA
jgi:hypothetical protein